jgi:hypothetical protein
MFVTDKLIYLQLQKTACSHIAAMLQKTVGGRKIGLHIPLPRRLYSTDKYVVGSIRNPWDWYVSQWSYGCSGRGALHNRLTDRKFFRFFEQPVSELKKPVTRWREAYRDHRDPDCFKSWLKLILDPARKRDLGEGYARSPISNFAGLLTYRYTKIYTKDLPQAERRGLANLEALQKFESENNALSSSIRVESIEDDLLQALKGAGYTLGENQIQAVRSGAENRTNPSEHLPPEFYYDDETADLVNEHERFIIEKYNYKPAR